MNKFTHVVTEEDKILYFPVIESMVIPEDLFSELVHKLDSIDYIIEANKYLNSRIKHILRRKYINPMLKKLDEFNLAQRSTFKEITEAIYSQLAGKWWAIVERSSDGFFPLVGDDVVYSRAIYAYELFNLSENRQILSVLEQKFGDEYEVHLSTRHWNFETWWDKLKEKIFFIQITEEEFQSMAEAQVKNVIQSRNQKIQQRMQTGNEKR